MILLIPLLLGTLLQESQGVQANLQYQYDYTGAISTQLPNDPKQSSGAALRAVVALQLSASGDILVKISNIEVGERNGKEVCVGFEQEGFPYREMDPEDAALLQIPFLVHVNESQVSYMEVPSEPAWVSNIRRGIINTIPLVVLTNQHPSRLSFGLKEETMIGSCFNWYSMLKLTGHQAKVESKKLEEVIEVDVQREGGAASYTAPKGKNKKSTGRKKYPGKKRPPTAPLTVAPIQDTLFIVTRSLDDQQCKDKHFTMKINGNKESVERTQRSSEGTFVIRGEGAVVRLERAEVEGNIMIYTGDCDDEFIWTTSKQTLQLTSVQEVEETISISYEAERRALSFSVADGPRDTIKEKLLGLSPAAEQVEENMAGILEDLSILRRNMQGEEAPEFLKVFQRLAERMLILSWTEIEDIVSRIATSTRDKYIIYQAALASGRDEVLIPMLELLKNQNLDFWFHYQILQSPLTPVRNPALIPAMLEVISSTGEDESGAKALSLLNIAKLANRYCLNSETGNLCDPGCDTDFILTNFLPLLSRGLYDQEKWKRIVTVQAVCALGSPYSIPYLQPIIQGTNNEDIDVRINAISCLTNDHLPKTAINVVFDSLVPLMKNPTEFPEIRSMAFLVLTTWEPSLSWWEEVAFSTWKEKSPQVLSVISSTLTTLSEGNDSRSKYAKKVVHLAKHPSDSDGETITRSIYLYMEEVVRNCQMELKTKMAWLVSTKSIFPSSIYWQLQVVSTMGSTQQEKGFIFTNVLQDYYKNMYAAIHAREKDYEDQELFSELYAELIEELELIFNNNEDEEPFTFGMLLEPLPLLAVPGSRHASSNMIVFLWTLMSERIPAHFRMPEMILAFPSDLGLPVVVKYEEDYAFMLGVTMGTGVTVETNYNHLIVLKASTLVPWSNGITVGVGIENSFDVNLMLSADVERRDGKDVVVLSVSPEQKAKIIYLSSVMYSSMTKLYHVVDSLLTSEESDSTSLGRRVIWNRRPKEGTDLLLPDFGLHLLLKWSCDLENPSDFTNVIEKLLLSQLVYQNFEYMLLVDLENSRMKIVTFTFSFDKKERQEEFPEQETDYDGQFTQDLSDLDLFSQEPQSPSQTSGFDGFEVPNEVIFDRQQQHTSSLDNYLGRMQEMIMPTTGGTLYTAIMTVEPDNSTQKYDVAVTLASIDGNVNEKGSTKVHVVFMKSPALGFFGDTHMTCLDIKMETPFVLPLLPKELLSETDLATNFLMNLYSGGHCEGPPGMKMQGMFGVSPAAVQNILSAEDTCVGDLGKRRPIYDLIIGAVTWTQDFRHLYRAVEDLTLNQLQSLSTANVKIEGDRPDNELIIRGVLNEEEWNVTVTRPELTSIFLVPDMLFLSPYDTFVSFEKVCHITSDSVQTYDGLTYAFQGPSCWVTATIFSDSKTPLLMQEVYNDLQMAVQVRFTDQWEVRLTAPSYAVVIDMTRSDIFVNDEPLIGQNEKFIVHRLQNRMMIKIGMVLIRVGDTVDVMVSDVYYGAVKGICGNYDGEPINDMMGPTGCLYEDPALHTLAWSTSARTDCRRFTLRNEKKVLSGYREECDRGVFQPTGLSQDNVMKNCTEWKYEERQSENGISCKSKIPHPVCKAGCNQNNASTKQLGYSCRMSPIREENVRYGENLMCSNMVSPILYSTTCSNL